MTFKSWGRQSKAAAAVPAVLMFLVSFLTSLAAVPASANYASLVIDSTTGEVLHEANADLIRYPASLTKMMTLYMLFGALDQGVVTLDEPVILSSRAAAQPPTKIGLKAGQSISVENAILAVITKSANDIAAAIGEKLSGSERAFAWRMTAQAHALGMTRTTFANASGLPDPEQVTTARDMGILALALLHHYPHYYHYFGTEQFAYRGAVHPNHNRLLGSYAGLDGIKTGYTYASGFNLVASAQRGGRRLVGVVMGARSPATRSLIMSNLLDQGFSGDAVITAYAEPEAAAAVAAAAAAAPVARATERVSRRVRSEPRQACATRDRRSGCALAARQRTAPRAAASAPVTRTASRVSKSAAASRSAALAPRVAKSKKSTLAASAPRNKQQARAESKRRPAIASKSPPPRAAARAAPGRKAKATAGRSKVRIAEGRRQPAS